MAQPYRSVHASFWTGRTGRLIRVGGPTAQVLALYAITSPHANMIGLYRLPLDYVKADTGLPEETILATFKALEAVDYLKYDAEEGWMWVCSMVAWQVGEPKEGKEGKPDKRRAGVLAQYLDADGCPFQTAFYEKHGAIYDLPQPPEAPCKPLISPFQAPCISETETETETETGTENGADAPALARGLTIDVVRFETFWSAYPRKTAKADARKEWRRQHPDDALTNAMIAAIEKQKQTRQWQQGVIPHARTWLHQHRWEDDVGPESRGSPQPRGRIEQALEGWENES